MSYKCHSKQIYVERYDYILVVGENIFYPVKARPGEVLIVHSISCYNNTQSDYTLLYKLLKRRGLEMRVNYQATLKAGVVHRFVADNYLIDGDETGIALTPNVAGNTVEVTVQCIRLIDAEFYKSI